MAKQTKYDRSGLSAACTLAHEPAASTRSSAKSVLATPTPACRSFQWMVTAGALAMAGAVHAQEAPQGAQEEIQEVVITGTHIQPPAGMTTPTPVTAVSADEMDKMAPGNLISALDQMPAFFNNTNATNTASSGVSDAGGSNLNLRGLGTARTLVLLDGRRVVPNSKEGAINVDIFPQALVERVEVVTGGASAAYGTDAVAGVVNFVLDTDFTGLEADVQGGMSRYGDNQNAKLDLTWGHALGERMNLILSGQYATEDGIDDWVDRPWYEGWAEMTNPEFEATGQGPRLITARDVVGTNFTCGGLIDAPGTPIHRLQFNDDGSLTPFVQSDLSVLTGTASQSLASGRGGSGCDPARLAVSGDGPQVTADHTTSRLFGYYNFDVTDSLNLFAQVLYADDQLTFNGASSTMATTWAATIFADNAFLPEEIRQIMQADANGDGRPDIPSFRFHRDNRELLTEAFTDLINRTTSAAAGFKYTFASGPLEGWRVNGYYQRGKNEQTVRFRGAIQTRTLPVALDAVRDPATGRIVCRASLFDPVRWGDCVPINLFGRGNWSEEARRYVTTPTNADDAVTYLYDLTETDAELSATGEIWRGWGAGPISGAFGISYREQEITSARTGAHVEEGTPRNGEPGIRGIAGGLSGDPDILLFNSYAALNNSFDVKEAFAETLIPLVSGVRLVDQLNASAAVRWADYAGSGEIWAWKAGLDWRINADVRLRTTFSRDVRAATLSERFDVQRTNGRVENDPVTGLTYNFSQTTGGNPEVDPEKADTFTVGLVYQPSWLSGLSMSIDWYDVSIKDAIGQLGTQAIVDRCAEGAVSLCELITRDPQTQLITDLRNVFININKEKARGIDLEVDYVTNPRLFGGAETLAIRAIATWLAERSTTVPGAPKRDVVGQINVVSAGDQFAFPEYQATLHLNYQNGPFGVFVQQRYIHSGVRDPSMVEGVDVDENDVSSVMYTDLRLSYTRDWGDGGEWEVFAHVANLFDKVPPLAPDSFSSLGGSVQTNTALYDVKGQRFILGARFSF